MANRNRDEWLRPTNLVVMVSPTMTRVRMRVACQIAFTLIALPLWSQQVARPVPRLDAWMISQPYPNNPLRLATLEGSVAIAGETRSADPNRVSRTTTGSPQPPFSRQPQIQ